MIVINQLQMLEPVSQSQSEACRVSFAANEPIRIQSRWAFVLSALSGKGKTLQWAKINSACAHMNSMRTYSFSHSSGKKLMKTFLDFPPCTVL